MSRFHWRQRLAIPPVAIGMQLLYDGNLQHFWPGVFISLLFTTLLWEGNLVILNAARRRFPRPDQIVQRFLWQVPAHIVFTLVAGSTIKWVLAQVIPDELCNGQVLAHAFLLNLIPTSIVVLIYETVYFFQQWKANLTRVEALARSAVQSELEVLRQQLDPHFLFNSLNTLAALIDEDADGAQRYLSQLADVYRYVLLVRERDTVSLEEELAFVDAYLYLSKTRFRDNLQVENTIRVSQHQRRVAPLSVQTLVENALKHNAITRDHPLCLRLEEAGADAIRVVNSVRPKTTLSSGTRLGLQNLVRRYALLTSEPVAVAAGDTEWAVRLPLL